MDDDSHVSLEALNGIRDHTYLLTLGGAYLCEEPFLIKIGQAVESRLETVGESIAGLKKQFPGKFVSEVNTDELLERLRDMARSMQVPDKALIDRCTVGELGRELEKAVRDLSRAIKTVRMQVDGPDTDYSGRDSAAGIFHRAEPIASRISFPPRMLALPCIILVILFSSLFFTMERESSILKDIAREEALIQSKRQNVSQLEKDRKRLYDKSEALNRNGLSRVEKIEIMELEIEVRDLDVKIQETELDIGAGETRIRDYREKIEEIRKKPFFKRLLRLS